MSTISLCMIVKNEEEVLARCLDGIKDMVDEIVIVDTGSTDKTKEIALQYTDKVFDFEWIDDFSAARNYSFSKATMDYQLWLDADDILTEENQMKLKHLKETMDGTVDSYSMQYHLSYDEQGKPTFSFHRFRLVKRSNNYKWIGFVHEFLTFGGKIEHTTIAISHAKPIKRYSNEKSDRNLKIYELHKEKGHDFTTRDLFYYANELRDHEKFENAVSTYQAFLSRADGWVEDKIRACLYLADCFKRLGLDNLLKDILLTTFLFDSPRAEVCCKIGDIHKENNEYAVAARWYELAPLLNEDHNQGFRIQSYSTWYPHLQLSVCYWNLRMFDEAKHHHLMAKNHAPENQTIAANDQYFI